MLSRFLFWLNEEDGVLFAISSFSHLKLISKMTFMSLFYQNWYSALFRPSIFIISLLIPLMVHEYMLYVTFVASKIDLWHLKRDASKNVPTPTIS